ncbi:MAG: DUF1998 domain-containing protein [Tindallia sp. MSAO_Bac2]|nr:MAG: DUF1998 domain-containing protein [Tindallia sp. MSAO_Bac2]
MAIRLEKRRKKRYIGEIRRSNMITTFGAGALVDFPKFSGIMAGIDSWKIPLNAKELRISERNLENLLGKEYFVQPTAPEADNRYGGDDSFAIPAFRFPNMYYCPKCHMLDYYWKIFKRQKAQCIECNSVLIPSRFITSCINGHIDDFPYTAWVHKGKTCEKPVLTLNYEGKTGGLDSIIIGCEACKAKRSMEGSMSKDALKGFKCYGKMPWLRDNRGKEIKDTQVCHAKIRTLQRSASNVYYSVNQSALTIPPWSNIIHEEIKKNEDAIEICNNMEMPLRKEALKEIFKQKIKKECKCSFEEFITEVEKVYSEEKEEINEKTLLINEYNAFCTEDKDDKHFKTSLESVSPELENYISEVKLVKRLREVQVLLGFRRILPEYEEGTEGLFEKDYTPISKSPLSWLPAVELFGEGIFIKFNEERLKEWERKYEVRYNAMKIRLNKRTIGKEMMSTRYVLLHTMAHLLIRQLSLQSGYSSASIKEKIYSTFDDIDISMAGILIYTAATDCDGSLGGLVREGKTNRFSNTIKGCLEEASWCSADPLCIDSTAQGMDSLNYAACHACVLLPETSCEARNCLLDRAAVVGTPDERDIGYFSSFMGR